MHSKNFSDFIFKADFFLAIIKSSNTLFKLVRKCRAPILSSKPLLKSTFLIAINRVVIAWVVNFEIIFFYDTSIHMLQFNSI